MMALRELLGFRDPARRWKVVHPVQTRLARARLWVTAMRPMFWAAASSKILFKSGPG